VSDDWAQQRREAYDEHVAALERRRAAETAKAQGLVEAFVTAARTQGVEPHPLTAGPSPTQRYRTSLVGWYVKPDRSLGVDTQGRWYILGIPASLRARFGGARVEPSDPPLQVGEGARDGESVALAELLEMRLAAGDDWH
jgi:hypothetical protein